jgi:nucleotide-binding universal stress UspA family protein
VLQKLSDLDQLLARALALALGLSIAPGHNSRKLLHLLLVIVAWAILAPIVDATHLAKPGHVHAKEAEVVAATTAGAGLTALLRASQRVGVVGTSLRAAGAPEQLMPDFPCELAAALPFKGTRGLPSSRRARIGNLEIKSHNFLRTLAPWPPRRTNLKKNLPVSSMTGRLLDSSIIGLRPFQTSMTKCLISQKTN